MIAIADITTSYHHLGMISYLQHHKPDISELIVIKKTFFSKGADYEYEALKSLAKKVVFIDNLEALKSYISRKKGSTTYIFSTNRAPIKVASILNYYKCPYHIVVIEEGIGTYGNLRTRIIGTYIQSKAQLNRPRALFITLRYCLSLVIKKFYFRNDEIETWLNFDLKSLRPNPIINKSYINALMSLSKSHTPTIQNINFQSGDCLLISSPLCETGHITEEDFIVAIKKHLPKYKNIYVKPHPIEKIDKYTEAGFKVINSSLAIEKLMIEINKDIDCYAFSSTSIYTLNLFLNLKIRRIHELDLYYSQLNKKQKKIINICSIKC